MQTLRAAAACDDHNLVVGTLSLGSQLFPWLFQRY